MDIKQKILSTAETLFMRYGIKSVTMDDLAKELAMSKKTIYQFFKDKNEVVKLTTEAHLEREKSDLEAIQQQAENAIEEIHKVSQLFRQRVLGLNPSLLFDLEKYHPEAWTIFEGYQDVFIKLLKATLARGKEEGFFRPELDEDILAKLRLHQVQLSFDPRVFPPNQYDYRQVQLQLIEHYFNGVVTEKGKHLLDSYQNNPSA